MNRPVKKIYTAPAFESIAIDQEVALVMMSPIPGEELAPALPKTKTKKASPFGGNKPDYGN